MSRNEKAMSFSQTSLMLSLPPTLQSRTCYPLEYNICHQFFNSNIITTLQISRSSKPCLDTSYMQEKKGFQIYYISQHSNFLVAQGPPLSSDISKTNENSERKICQCICINNRLHWAEFEQNR